MFSLRIPKPGSISGFIFSLLLLCSSQLTGQDTLRTYGPRIGIDIARFVFLLSDPAEIGAEASLDLEVYKNIYPVFELGYNTVTLNQEEFNYSAGGIYGRFGMDYNLLPVKDRSVHHSIFAGGRYGISFFKQQAENIVAPNSYWGDFYLESYDNNLTGHWLELVGGVRAELADNFFLGWTIRYKIMLSRGKDELMTPYLIPGFGKVSNNRSFGISYHVMYKIPLFKK